MSKKYEKIASELKRIKADNARATIITYTDDGHRNEFSGFIYFNTGKQNVVFLSDGKIDKQPIQFKHIMRIFEVIEGHNLVFDKDGCME